MRMRRRVLRALAVLAVASGLGIGAAQAQDAATSVVQAAARDWLVLADKGDAGATYDAAGAQFRKAMTRERWGEALASVRKPLGALQRRTMAATTFRTAARRGPAAGFRAGAVPDRVRGEGRCPRDRDAGARARRPLARGRLQAPMIGA